MTNDAKANDKTIDRALIADVVRKVIARLQQTTTTNIDARLITLETIERHDAGQLVIDESAVITPAARDEARRRGIAIQRLHKTKITTNRQTDTSIADTDDPNRADTVLHQLGRRGAKLGTAKVILSDTPASETHKQIISGNRATMVTAIADVERFAGELDPNVWVLDMKRLNIPAAVNTVVKISQLGSRSR
jgi:hypothetical protein